MLTFPVEQLPDGRFKVWCESVVGRNPIGPRLWKSNPDQWPDIQDTFDTEAEAKTAAARWESYCQPQIKVSKRGKSR